MNFLTRNADRNLTDVEAQALVAKVQSGDKAAEAALVNHYTRLAFTVARSFYSYRSIVYDEDDMLQDALMRILIQAKSYDGRVPFRVWVAVGMRINIWTRAWNEIRRRRKFHASRTQQLAASHSLGVQLHNDIHNSMAHESGLYPDGLPGFFDMILADVENHHDFLAIVSGANLTSRQRSIIVQRSEGKKISDIASQLGVHTATVNRDIATAMDAMKELVRVRP